MDLDLEISGLQTMLAELEELKQDFEGNPVTIVFARAEYAQFLEFGRGPIEPDTAEALRFEVDGEVVYATHVSGHPPYPFFRPAINEFRADPERFIDDNTGVSIDEIDSLPELVKTASAALETQLKKNVTAQRGAGRSPGTHSEHPQVQTGNLRQSIGWVTINE